MEPAVSQIMATLEAHRASVLSNSIAQEFRQDSDRFQRFHVFHDDLLFDFSKQRIEAETLAHLSR